MALRWQPVTADYVPFLKYHFIIFTIAYAASRAYLAGHLHAVTPAEWEEGVGGEHRPLHLSSCLLKSNLCTLHPVGNISSSRHGLNVHQEISGLDPRLVVALIPGSVITDDNLLPNKIYQMVSSQDRRKSAGEVDCGCSCDVNELISCAALQSFSVQ